MNNEQSKVNPQSQTSGIAAVIIFFVLLFVFSKWGPAINFSTISQSKGEPFVVSGEGKVSVAPDIAKVTVGIQETGNSLKTVQTSVNTKSKTLIEAIKKVGVGEDEIKTTSYNVYPQYDYSQPSQRITGYQVSTNYEVKIKDFDKVNEVVSIATANGANIVGNISFDLNPDTKTEKMNEARELAVRDAKDKASGLAKAAGITLGKIININENQEQNNIRPVYAEKALDMAGAGSIPQPNIEPGQTEINITVSLSYEVR